ncbi:MAG: molybdenum cofactor guanylyltransferase [Bacteroidota bacterium]|nr:molybdenum cofactor guanylyltransferase [Bacteroidota bacterium]
MKVTGIILAGGKSSRMKTEKGLVRLDNKPLIEYVIDVLEGFCDTILISSNSNAYIHYAYQVVSDEIQGIGPVSGIFSGLKASSTADNIVLSCDTPFINAGFLNYLLKNHSEAMVAVPWFGDDKYEPMTAYYHKEFADKLSGFIQEGNYKLPEIFKEIPVQKLIINNELDFYHDKLFYNVNSREDIDKLNIET